MPGRILIRRIQNGLGEELITHFFGPLISRFFRGDSELEAAILTRAPGRMVCLKSSPSKRLMLPINSIMILLPLFDPFRPSSFAC
ncbi:Uncharacterised protein [Bordetella pertussis]|nr:Uncharacterised protein [Bordetella pertussis]